MIKRLSYLGTLLLVIMLGLLSRKWSVISLSIGDGLWAVAVYLAWRVLLPRWQVKQIFVLALLTAFTVEFSQLLTWDWLVLLRQTRLGYLILGQGFLLSDLVAYSLALVFICGLDSLFYKGKRD